MGKTDNMGLQALTDSACAWWAPHAGPIDTLVNTCANGDHCHGNELVAGASTIACTASAAAMAGFGGVGPGRGLPG